ncbi:MAG: hypothetical protein Q8R83_06160 [Legionellaceae bacterium]|nr:hypothetical protein [Legionellaceae bacterium]
MKNIEFEVIPGNVIPEKSDNESSRTFNVSDPFFGKCETVSGNISKYVIIYDFHNSNWISAGAGLKRVIEYYR